ncbi:MAG: transglutaminase domain-containing protein [Ferruginibacter sp.]
MKKTCTNIQRLHFTRSLHFLLIFSLLPHAIEAQKTAKNTGFANVDSFVLGIKYENDYIKLARDLTSPFHEDMDKVRAIFKWITNNIAYDYRFINSGKELQVPECEDRYDCVEITRSWENEYIKKILRTRRATADGYAKLFQKLCDIMHIQTELIPGYLRTKPYQIGSKMSVNHTWNAVFIDTAWYFVDPTLAAGYCIENEETDRLVRFVRDYEEYYWLTPFNRLARNHFPKNGYWGNQYHLTLEKFFTNPHYYSIDVLDNISNECPSEGMLSVKKDDTLHFSFNYKKDIRYIQVNSNNFRNPSLWTTITVKRKTKVVRDTWAEKKQVYIPFKKLGQSYSFDYVVKDMSLYYLELVFDYKKIMRYKVTVSK